MFYNEPNKKIYPWLIFAIVLFLFSVPSAWGSSHVDTLKTRADYFGGWSGLPTHVSDSLWINWLTNDVDTSYNFMNITNITQITAMDSCHVTGIIDSVGVFYMAKKVGTPPGTMVLGRWYYDSEGHIWVRCNAYSYDTLLVSLTTNYTLDSLVWVNDPCTVQPWDTTYINYNLNGWGVTTRLIPSKGFIRITWAFVLVYWHDAVGGKKGLGGIIQDEDKRGLIEGGIAR